MMKYKKWRKVLLTAAIMILATLLLQELLMPKYMHDIIEGAMIREYYQEEKNHDVIFIGDCELYENISPAVLWEEYGINSYIRGSAQQLVWQSYYLLEETLRYEKPDAVVFSVLSMKYNEPQKEAYNRMTLDGMRWSSSKIKDIQASMTKEESFVEYVFPLLRYHSRWKELTSDDFKYLFHKDTVTYNGYYMRVDVKPAENVPKGKPLTDYQFGENAYLYLNKMLDLCRANGVELILVKAPSLYPYWYEQWEKQMVDFAAKNNLKYYNFLDKQEEIGLDFTKDTYDAGLHLNLAGAEKLSSYFGKILTEECNIKGQKENSGLRAGWEKKLEAYHAEQERQEKQWNETGTVE